MAFYADAVMTPERVAYESTPEWEAYQTAYENWITAHVSYGEHPSTENRASLIQLDEHRQRLLEVCRATPEHVAAFGW